ncbi:MAG: VCBS repeat-containing protein, partial [Eudoraea sp.]|nr:VCBS repeat-containing protein [Eudoraea sp.]
PNYAYHNSGNLKFTKANKAWGMEQESLSNGAAYGDLDNDGDLDLVVNNIESEPFVYRNNTDVLSNNHYLKVKLVGNTANTYGVGAKVALHFNEDQKLVQELLPSRGYQSSVDYQLVFGLGARERIDSLIVFWPEGSMQTMTAIRADTTVTIYQKDASRILPEPSLPEATFFSDVTSDSLLIYKHIENNFIDFKREQLLPHKLSTQGPKIAKADINGDGLQDLFIGGAKGTPGKLYLQSASGEFNSTNQALFENDLMAEDMEALFFDADNDRDMDLYVVSGGADFTLDDSDLQDRLYFNNGRGEFKKRAAALPQMTTSGGCVTASDFDADGDLDLFVGGRMVPGRYPTAPRSYILANDGSGNFTDITSEVNPELLNPGMVTDAVWTDIDADKDMDLMLVGEWMPVRIFENTTGQLNEITMAAGTAGSEGWWNTISPGDFDNDGDTDYVLGNFGCNSQLKASEEEPVQLYVKDFDGNGSLDPVLCSYIMGESYPVYSKDDLVGQLNNLKSRYVNYADYAGQKITDIFSAQELADARILKATHFESSYLENLGGNSFRLSALPEAAQFSPVYSVLNKDVNADGHADLIVTGNFFGTRVKYGRYDANKGVLLLGNGRGQFREIDVTRSGLLLNGEVRDAVIIRQAGGEELVIFARNNDELRVYKLNQ